MAILMRMAHGELFLTINYTNCMEPDVIGEVNAGRMRWLGHLAWSK
jgi:hypothetical protein